VFGVYGHLPPVMNIGLLATLAEMCRMGLPMEDYTCAICELYINAVCKQPNRNTGQAASFPVYAKQRAWNAGSMTSRGVHRPGFPFSSPTTYLYASALTTLFNTAYTLQRYVFSVLNTLATRENSQFESVVCQKHIFLSRFAVTIHLGKAMDVLLQP
jgi:hypothetical protein